MENGEHCGGWTQNPQKADPLGCMSGKGNCTRTAAKMREAPGNGGWHTVSGLELVASTSSTDKEWRSSLGAKCSLNKTHRRPSIQFLPVTVVRKTYGVSRWSFTPRVSATAVGKNWAALLKDKSTGVPTQYPYKTSQSPDGLMTAV